MSIICMTLLYMCENQFAILVTQSRDLYIYFHHVFVLELPTRTYTGGSYEMNISVPSAAVVYTHGAVVWLVREL